MIQVIVYLSLTLYLQGALNPFVLMSHLVPQMFHDSMFSTPFRPDSLLNGGSLSTLPDQDSSILLQGAPVSNPGLVQGGSTLNIGLGGSALGTSADTNGSSFQQWCDSQCISDHTKRVLANQGCDSMLALGCLQPGDLESMGLGVGQLRILQAALNIGPFSRPGLNKDKATPGSPSPPTASHGHVDGSANVISSDSPVPPSPMAPTAGTDSHGVQSAVVDSDGLPIGSVVNPEAVTTSRLLGIGPKGENVDYLKITKHITMRSNDDDDDQDAQIKLPDGSCFVHKSGGSRKLHLDSVSPLQYMEANARILAKLILRGMSAADIQKYLAYNILVARLGQRFTWQSVLHFDDEFRSAQAVENFKWDSDAQHMRDLNLRLRESKPATKSSAGSQTKGENNLPRSRGAKQKNGGGNRLSSGAEGENRLCFGFNQGKCSFNPCKWLHFCNKCGSPTHGRVDHDQSGSNQSGSKNY